MGALSSNLLSYEYLIRELAKWYFTVNVDIANLSQATAN